MNPTFDLAGRLLIGTVVENEIEGGLKQGEVRVSIPSVYGNTPDNLLPVAFHFKNDSGGCKSFGVLTVGTKVIVELQDGDPQCPIVRCRAYDGAPQEFLDGYPNVYGWYDETGNVFYVNKATKLVRFTDGAGATLTIQNGALTSVTASANITVNGAATVHATGVLTLKSDSKVVIQAPLIEEN